MKMGVVGAFQQVDKFVDDKVFEAVRRFFDQLGVEENISAIRIAASPFGFHAADKEFVDFYMETLLPFGNQRFRFPA